MRMILFGDSRKEEEKGKQMEPAAVPFSPSTHSGMKWSCFGLGPIDSVKRDAALI